MSRLISLKQYVKDLENAKLIFGLSFDIPKEILKSNLIVREIHITDIGYNSQWKIQEADLEMFVEPIDKNKPIPKIEH